jgi:NADPH:quinone reductase-like Zn-dependent oxidoreductase
MKAIILKEAGGPDTLNLAELPVPQIKSNEVLVQVKAISINPVDAKSRSGKGLFGRLKEELPLILGWDISGVVVEIGSDCEFDIGDEVFGMINFPGHGKAYAEFVAAPALQLAVKPKNITHAEAAAATLAALTAYQALVHKAKVTAGQHVLIHAAAGGVGHFAVQIAKHLGAEVTGTSSEKNREFVMALGANHHIDYQAYDWSASGKKFDFILDTIGG